MYINGKKVVPITKKANPLEKVIEKTVNSYAKARGFYVRKFNSEGQRSVPDALLINPHGYVFFIEFKRLGKKPTPAQLLEHEHIKQCRGNVYIIDNIKDGKALIDQFAKL